MKTYNTIITNTKQNHYIHGWAVYKKMLILLAIISTIWNLMNYLSSRNNNIYSSPENQQPEQTSTSSHNTHNNISFSLGNGQLEQTSLILQDCKDKCKFFFPYFMPEQETKANLHIRSFVQLAESLDRILVIPNVGISRVRACLTFSPSFYYNLELLQQMFPNAKFTTQKEYELWVDNQPNHKKLVAEHILFKAIYNITVDDYKGQQEDPQNGLYKSFTIADSSSIYYKRRMNFIKNYKTCPYDLKLNKLNLTQLKEVRLLRNGFLNHAPERRVKFSKFLTNALKSDSQILLISSNFRQPLFPNMQEPIPYAKHILNENSNIINRLGSSYIAIHWRMEQARPANLPGCAKDLVKTINNIRKKTGIKNVYLATDYPITYNKDGSINNKSADGIKTQSDTFSRITTHHVKAMNILTSSIKGIETWKSLNAFGYLDYNAKKENEKVKSPLIDELEGPGVQGILDKLVCINSNYFLSGPRGCCRISSGFTKQIAHSRTQLLIKGNRNILNTITRWPMNR